MAISHEQVKRIKEVDLAYGGINVVPRKEYKSGDLRMEYLTKEGDLIVHFFWERRHPTQEGTRSLGEGFPEQPIYAPWPQVFREVAWRALIREFRMQGKEDQVNMEWVNELFSYDGTVKGVAVITAPSNSMMVKLLDGIVALLDD
jgi:hypothetical protein